MLKEHISYHNNLPFSIGFFNVAYESPHYHEEMEITLILQGYAKYKVYQQDYYLREGEALIIDTEDLHYIYESSNDVIALTMYVNVEFFDDIYPDIDFMIFPCDGYEKEARSGQQQNKMLSLKNYLAKIMMLVTEDESEDEVIMERIQQFLYILTNYFHGFLVENNQFKANLKESSETDLSRLYRIIKYIYLNYDKKITLDDLAELEHLSPYYVSHLIKGMSGLSFQNFLSYVRVEYAEKFLVENKLTLTQISEFCGFSSLAYFNKCFFTWQGMTPSQYRKQPKPCERAFHQPIAQETAIYLLKQYLSTYDSQQDEEILKNSARHICIPMKMNLIGGMKGEQAFPLRISADSHEEILRLGYYREQINRLSPSSIVISEKILKEIPDKYQVMANLEEMGIPLESVKKTEVIEDDQAYSGCTAFFQILTEPNFSVKLFGEGRCLFTEDGLPTPYYSVYELLAPVKGSIAERKDTYVIVKSNQSIFLLILNNESTSLLNAHIKFNKSKSDLAVIKKTLAKEHSVTAVLDALGGIEGLRQHDALNRVSVLGVRLKEHIEHATCGTVNFTHIKKLCEPNLDLEIHPDTLIMLEFIPT